MRKGIVLMIIGIIGANQAAPQQLEFPKAAATDQIVLAKVMPGLATQVLATYKEEDRGRYLDNLFRLQMIAGRYADALASIGALRGILGAGNSANAQVMYLQYEIFSKAKILQGRRGIPFNEAFKLSFRAAYAGLSDTDAYQVSSSFNYDLSRARNDLRETLGRLKDKNRIDMGVALELARQYQPVQVYEIMSPLAETWLREDDAKRYTIQDNVLIKTKDGATLSAIVVRKKGVPAPQPTAFVFTIYADIAGDVGRSKYAAARGYAGVTAYTRGKASSPDEVVPYEYDGRNAASVIDWIISQPWSDGKVGMYGGSYNGFTCWAAAKALHPALKTIVPYVANNPGDGLPMENNIFLFVNYAWAFYVTDNKSLDDKIYSDRDRWNSLNGKWYASGKSYRQIDSIDGTPNIWYQRWLRHPNYDKYWQDMVPYKDEFAKINIPVLTITGYYDDGQQSALYYLKQHYKYNKNADHFLVIGPYDHFGAQRARKDAVLRGYAIDPVAQIDTPDLTFQWLDYVLRHGQKPALLQDKINYEVMGANEWKHAPSLEILSRETLTLYLTDAKSGDRYRLAGDKPAKPAFLYQEVDFSDRKTTNNNDYYPDPIVGQKPDFSNGFSFISEPFDEPISIAGTFSGVIKASINKKDMDIGVVLYEVMPNGELFHLSYFLGRASYAKDMSVRTLLTPERVESIPFDKTRMVSRRLSKGSRLLVMLNVNKNPFAQINYGTGKDVSDEDIRDAKVPLKVRWLNDSYIKVPISK
jgi:hypothetical protein